MTPAHRRSFAKCIRSLSTEDAAVQLLEAYELQVEQDREAEGADVELRGLEQLPAWTHGNLLAWAMSHSCPDAIQDAASVQIMREFRLIGDLARASEQAMFKGEVQHAQRIARVLAKTWECIRGEQLLSMAFSSEDS